MGTAVGMTAYTAATACAPSEAVYVEVFAHTPCCSKSCSGISWCSLLSGNGHEALQILGWCWPSRLYLAWVRRGWSWQGRKTV